MISAKYRDRHAVRTRAAGVIAVALSSALLLAACSGGDSSGAGETSTTTRPDGVNTEALHSFLETAAAGKTAVFAATFTVELPGTQIPKGELRLAQEGERRMSELVGGPKDPSVGFYDSGSGTVACARLDGEAEWQCYSTTGDAANAPLVLDLQELFEIEDQLRPAQYWFEFSTSEDEVAGAKTTCLSAKALPEMPDEMRARLGDSAKFCVAESGVPLLLDLRGGDNPILVTATEYRTDVDEGDFSPPAPVQDGPPGVLVPAPPEEVPGGEPLE